MSAVDLLEAIRTRRSISKLVEPAPSAIELETIFQAAVHAPDHKELAPWRFIVIDGDNRGALGDVFAHGLQLADPHASEGRIEKERSKATKPPMIIAVAAKSLDTKLAFSELVAATCAATQNLLLAAHSLGFGAVWKTGNAVSSDHVKRALGLDPADEIVGFVHIGTPGEPAEPRTRSTEGVVSTWQP